MTTPRTLAFIVHGARAASPELRHLVGWVRDRGYHVDVRVTWEPGDAVRLTREALARGADTVVAVGGDGTVNEVLNGLTGSPVPLGIIPFGTANDFAHQAGIPDHPDHAMDILLRQSPVLIDTAELNGRRFLNVSTGGVAAEATAATPLSAKESLGTMAYAVTGMRTFARVRPHLGHVTGSGVDLTCKFFFVAVGNARATGGGSRVTPRALVTDGLLDVCLIEARPRTEFARLLLKLRRGDHLGEPGVHYWQLPALTIASRRAVAVNVDGEPLSARTLSYLARPRDLWIYLPRLPEDAPARG